MKKYIKKLMVGFLSVAMLAGCNTSNPTSSNNEDTIQIVTTIFPEYDWVKQIIGDHVDHVELTMLLDNGVDLHSFQPSAADIMKISNCDVFIYVGGESDTWVDDALKEAVNPDMKVINLIDTLGDSVKEEELKEGMEDDHDHDEEHDHDHEDEEEHDHEEESEYDEHVWLSLNNAKVICNTITEVLAEIDPTNAEEYQTNLENYTASLNEMDSQYQNMVDEANYDTILFGDRFPFRYLVDDYGLDYYAAFVGCSSETEASFSTITFLAEKMDELQLHTIFTLEKSDQKIAQTIVDNTTNKDQKIVTIDSMQSTSSKDIADGATYLSIMESNLEILKDALQ